MESWIADHDFVSALASGIAVDGGLDIAGEEIGDCRELGDHSSGNCFARIGQLGRARFGKAGNGPVNQAEKLLLEFFERRFGDPIGSRSR